jgi:ABC-type antimicrobial peptide transport system permease subunit
MEHFWSTAQWKVHAPKFSFRTFPPRRESGKSRAKVDRSLNGAVGLYSVLAYSVALRTREIGVRMALGASPRQLVLGFVGDGFGLMVPGIVVGLAASLALTRLLGSLLYGVTPIDPLTYAAVSLLLLVVGTFASWLPARQAAAIDPTGSLRVE